MDILYSLNSNLFLPLIQEIIRQIPNFLKCIFENQQIRTLVYYGYYIIGYNYNINNFIENGSLYFYKVFYFEDNNNEKNEKIEKFNKYIIITDMYFLFLNPNNDNKIYAELIYKFDIRKDLISCNEKNYHKDINKESIILNFNSIKLDILLLNSKNDTFINILKNKKINLEETFQNFLTINLSEKNNLANKFKKNKGVIRLTDHSLNFLIQFCEYKEKIFELKKQKNEDKNILEDLRKEIINLYEKIIGIKCSKNENFDSYIEKLKKFVSNEF